MLQNTRFLLWFFYRCLKLKSSFFSFFFLSGIQWNAIPSREMAPGPRITDRFYDPKSKIQLSIDLEPASFLRELKAKFSLSLIFTG